MPYNRHKSNPYTISYLLHYFMMNRQQEISLILLYYFFSLYFIWGVDAVKNPLLTIWMKKEEKCQYITLSLSIIPLTSARYTFAIFPGSWFVYLLPLITECNYWNKAIEYEILTSILKFEATVFLSSIKGGLIRITS